MDQLRGRCGEQKLRSYSAVPKPNNLHKRLTARHRGHLTRRNG